MLCNFRYYRGGRTAQETVDADIYENDSYKTTCVINVYSLTSYINSFPCGNGDDYELKGEELVRVLEFVRSKRESIFHHYKNVQTYEEWMNSGLPTFEDYCKPGDIVDEAMVDYFMNSVPPVTMSSSCAQAGEAYSHERDDYGKYRATYTTFFRLTPSSWRFAGYCFKGETTNRVEVKTRLDRRIEEVRANG